MNVISTDLKRAFLSSKEDDVNTSLENFIKQINDSWYLLGKNTYSSIADYYINNFNIINQLYGSRSHRAFQRSRIYS